MRATARSKGWPYPVRPLRSRTQRGDRRKGRLRARSDIEQSREEGGVVGGGGPAHGNAGWPSGIRGLWGGRRSSGCCKGQPGKAGARALREQGQTRALRTPVCPGQLWRPVASPGAAHRRPVALAWQGRWRRTPPREGSGSQLWLAWRPPGQLRGCSGVAAGLLHGATGLAGHSRMGCGGVGPGGCLPRRPKKPHGVRGRPIAGQGHRS